MSSSDNMPIHLGHVREALDRSGLAVVAEPDRDRLILRGAVQTDADRQRALDIAAASLDGSVDIEVQIDVAEAGPPEPADGARDVRWVK